MKTHPALISLFSAAFLTFTGCSESQPGTPQTAANAPSHQEDDSDKPPTIGMTKAQVRARYGDPKRETTTDDGEQWVYILNLGSVLAKSAIPFYFGGRSIKTGVVTFGPDGKVKKFTWDTKTED